MPALRQRDPDGARALGACTEASNVTVPLAARTAVAGSIVFRRVRASTATIRPIDPSESRGPTTARRRPWPLPPSGAARRGPGAPRARVQKRVAHLRGRNVTGKGGGGRQVNVAPSIWTIAAGLSTRRVDGSMTACPEIPV